MEAFQRLQAIDFVLVILWALIIGWGVKTGLIRQVMFVVSVYLGGIAAGQGYEFLGGLFSMISGKDTLPQAQLIAYVVLLTMVPALLMLITWRIYPVSGLVDSPRFDAIAGGVLGAVGGAFVAIGIVAALSLFTTTFWPTQQMARLTVGGELERAQVVPALRVAFSPLWDAMAIWFPKPIAPPT